jgi:exodeoxyribonuclease VII small subunit
MPGSTPIDQMSYEAAYTELESIVSTLEANQRPLDEAMALFERGQALAVHCAALLDQAELKVRQLTGADLLVPLDEEPEE